VRSVRDLLKGSALALTVKAAAVLAAFGMQIVVARALGASEAGLFFLAYTIILLASGFSRLGLEHTLVRFIAKDHVEAAWGRIKPTYATSIRWSLVAALGTAGLLIAAAHFLGDVLSHEPDFSIVVQLAALAIPFIGIFTLTAYALQGLQRVVSSVFLMNGLMPVGMVILILTVRPHSAADVAAYLAVASFVASLIGWVWWRMALPRPRHPSLETVEWATLRASCWPLWVGVMLAQAIAWSGQLMLGVWASTADVALFNAAQRSAATMVVLGASVNTILAPRLAAAYSGEFDGPMRRLVRSGTIMLALAAVVPALAMAWAAADILALFGPEFRDGALALQILSLGYFLHVAAGVQGFVLTMTGNERAVRSSVIVAAAIGIGTGLLLVPSLGLLGAAISTAIGVALQNLVCAWFVWWRLVLRRGSGGVAATASALQRLG
jgi:O-antigen/teichoic acid export membrane protein